MIGIRKNKTTMRHWMPDSNKVVSITMGETGSSNAALSATGMVYVPNLVVTKHVVVRMNLTTPSTSSNGHCARRRAQSFTRRVWPMLEPPLMTVAAACHGLENFSM